MSNMYSIQNHRINLDQISHVELGEHCCTLNGPGADIRLNAAESDTKELLEFLTEEEGWVPVNGNVVNPKAIVSMTTTPDGHLKVNVAGKEIWVPDEGEKEGLRPDNITLTRRSRIPNPKRRHGQKQANGSSEEPPPTAAE